AGLCFDCSANLIFNSVLTSGYYGGEPRQPKPQAVSFKCRHGGSKDSGTGPAGGINKDTRRCLFAPPSQLHDNAAGVAEMATKQFIYDIRNKVTMRQFKLLLGVGPTLAMAIDTTGSMGSVNGEVQARAIQIVDDRIGTDQEPLTYILSPFN